MQPRTTSYFTLRLQTVLSVVFILTFRFALAQSSGIYSVNWVNQVGVSTSGSQLTKTTTLSIWNAGATSSNVLSSNNDGWLEFSTASGSDFIIGFAVNNVINSDQLTYGIQIDNATGTCLAHEGTTIVSLGASLVGARFRIERVGSVVNYYNNNVVIRSVTVNAAIPLQVKAVIKLPSKTTPLIDVSFDSQLIVEPLITGTEGNGTVGSIALTVTGGTAPYSYNWSSGENTSAIVDKMHGNYSVEVTDAVGRTANATYALKYKINWIETKNASNDGFSLFKTDPLMTWNISGGSSSNTLSPNSDGWMQFTVSAKTDVIIGFAANNTIDADDFTHAFHIDNVTGTYRYFEGASTSVLGYWRAGDIFRIERIGSSILYFKNGLQVRSSSGNPMALLRTKATLRSGPSTPRTITSFDGQLIISPTVVGTEGLNGVGSINVVVIGGKTPYNYSWSSGEQTNEITGKPIGTYAVTITDGAGRTASRSCSIGYKLNWIDIMGVATDGVNLFKNSSLATWRISGGSSSNLLMPATDGWMEFVVKSDTDLIVGLSVNNRIDNEEFSGAFHFDVVTGTYRYYEGAASAVLGYWQGGDIFRIAREGGFVKYYCNGALVRSATIDQSFTLKVKATIRINSSNASTPTTVTSFDASIVPQPVVTGMEGNTGQGGIALSPVGGRPPYSYGWSTGEQISNLAVKPAGGYAVNVTDAAGRTRSLKVNIGYRVKWTNLAYAFVNGLVLTKNFNLAVYNAGGVSENTLKPNTDGWMEFVVDNKSDFIVGLSVNNIMNNMNQFSYGVLLDYYTGKFRLYEGTEGPWLAPLQSGDVIRISREGNQIRYYLNDTVIRTVTTNPALQLIVKTMLRIPSTNSAVINTSFWISDGIPRNYYAISSGSWTNPAIWSLTEGGVASSIYPSEIDNILIKGYKVDVESEVKSANVSITGTQSDTKLSVSGPSGSLIVTGKISLDNVTGGSFKNLLEVNSGGKLEVK